MLHCSINGGDRIVGTDPLTALGPDYQLHWYRIERVLGQGGFGITYLAYDTNLEQLVAIKEYLPVEFAARAPDEMVQPRTEEHEKRYRWGLDRFIAEARTLAKFDHPNIVRVYSVFEHNNTAYMVMRYEQGQNLQSMLARRRILEEEALMSILLPILDGLEEIHRIGFIHRDIKPDNIYIRNDRSPVLLDFGSARQAFGDARTLTILIAPGYAPFEQYYSNSDQQGPWTDIYSLGATLYRAVTGMPPPDAIARSKGILGSTRDILVPAAQAAKGHFSETLLRAVDHALEFNEKDRPQTIAEWRGELLDRPTDLAPPPRSASARYHNDADSPGATEQDPFDLVKPSTIPTELPTEVPTDSLAAPPAPRRTRWLRLGSLAAALAGAVAVGLLVRPYMEGGSASRDQEQQFVEKLRDDQMRLEESLHQLESKLSQVEKEKRLAEEEKRLAEAQAQRLEDEKRRAASESEQLTQAQRRVEEDQQRAEEEKRKAEQALRENALARDREIAKLLTAAEADLAGDRLSTPAGNNALEGYRAVLSLDPGNARAAKGIEDVVARYVELADRSVARRRFDQASKYLDRAEAALLGTGMVGGARERLAEARRRAENAPARGRTARPAPTAAAPAQSAGGEELALALDAVERGDFTTARALLEPLADGDGSAEASYALGSMFAKGSGVPRDDAEAVRRFREAAEKGYAPAQKSLGVMYATGRGVTRNETEAYEWYRLAAEQGNTDAQINLGNLYAAGRGVAQSDFQAFAWFAVAAAAGSRIAEHRRDDIAKKLQPVELEHAEKLARQYTEKFGLDDAGKPDPPEVVASVEPQADPRMIGDLASSITAYETGEYAEAYRGFKALADRRIPEAAYYLGIMNATGKGVSRSDADAVSWYRKAADSGYTPAQNSLGVMYATGRGVPRDESVALEWYRRAAEQGNADAQINLGNMYAEGRGVARSDFQAYAWYDVAADTGNPIASDRRDTIARNLQTIELEHARKLAQQYKKKYSAIR